MKVICIFMLLGVAFGQHAHNCIHNNHQQLTADQVVAAVVADADKDHDGVVTGAEITAEFLTRYDLDHDGTVVVHDFAQEWHSRYHDAHDFANYIFTQLDGSGDGSLKIDDIPLIAVKVDTNGDGKVTTAEFTTYMKQLYANCQSAHGGGGP